MDRPYYIPFDLIRSGALRSLSPSAAKVLLALAAHDNNDRAVFPSRPTLAAECDIDPRTLDDASCELERLGLLTVTRSKRGNRYLLLAPSVVTSNVPTSDVATSNAPTVVTSNAPTVVTSVVPTVVTSNAPLTYSTNSKQLTGSIEHIAAAPLAGFAGDHSSDGNTEQFPDVGKPIEDKSGVVTGNTESLVKGSEHKSPAKPKSAGKGKLTDEQMLEVCKSASAMAAYWCFGPASLGKATDDYISLPPTPTHWAPATGKLNQPEPNATLPQLAAFAWWRICRAREAAGLPISLPSFPKLVGTIKNLRSRMTQEQLVQTVHHVTSRWPSVASQLAWMVPAVQLDELCLLNPKVVAAASSTAAPTAPAPAVSSYVAQMNAGLDLVEFGRQLAAREKFRL